MEQGTRYVCKFIIFFIIYFCAYIYIFGTSSMPKGKCSFYYDKLSTVNPPELVLLKRKCWTFVRKL